MTKLAISLAAFLVAASSAIAQFDTFSLRSKYGAPLDPETFTVRPGIEMVLDYGPGKQVCRIQLPLGMRIVGTVPAGVLTEQQNEHELHAAVAPAVRGQ